MTPEDFPATITADSLFPWLHAIAPPVEPVRNLTPPLDAAGGDVRGGERPEPLRPAA